MKPRIPSTARLSLQLASALAAMFFTHSAQSQTLYWDNNGDTDDFGTASGTWADPTTGNSSQGWSTDAAGTLLPGDVTTSTANTLTFGNATNGLLSGNISVSGTVEAGNLTFASATENIGLLGGSITLGATSTISVNGTTTAGVATISSNLLGGGAISKTGTGMLVLSGNNTLGGAVSIRNGSTLRLENTNAASGATSVGFSTNANGVLQLGTDTAFTAADITLLSSGFTSSGTGNIVSDRLTSGAGLTHALGDLTIGNTSLNITAGSNVTSGTAAISFTNVGLNTSTSGGTTTLNPTTANLVVVGAATGSASTGTHTFALGGTSTGNSIGGVISNGGRTTQNVVKSNTSTWTLSGANTYNGATSVTLGTLTLANSLALQNSSLDTTASVLGTATDGFNATVATLTVGGLAGDKDLASVFITGGYSGVTALTLNPGTGVTHTYIAAIADGAADMTVTKTGAGTQVLSGANSYTGGTTVTAGILQPTLATALAFYNSPSEVAFNGGIIAVVLDETAEAGWSTAQVDSLLANATKTSGALGIDTTAASASFAPSNLSGNIGLTKRGANTLTLTSANTHTGNTTITTTTGGTLRLENTGAVQNSAVVSINNRILEIATNTAFSPTTPLSMNGGTIVSDRANAGAGLTHAFGNLAVAHNTSNFTAGTNVTSGTAAIQVASMTCASGSGGSATLNPTTADLIIVGNATGANTGTSTFNLGGTSQGNSIGGAVENGTRTTQNITKSNTSTWALNGVNTYTGNTTVSNGTLTLSNAPDPLNANTGNDASTVTISDNGTSFLNLTYTGTDIVDKLFFGAAQQPSGTYSSSSVPAGATITTASFLGGGTLTVGGGFSSWITGTFAGGATVPPSQQGENDDPDNDGISNLVEFAIAGQDPTVSNSTIGTFDGTTLSFTKRQPLASSLTYAIQESTDLGIGDDWDEVTGGSYVNSSTTISYTLTPGTPVRNFLRLQVISN